MSTLNRPSFCGKNFSISDATGTEVFTVDGPSFICSGVCCTFDYPFLILTSGSNAQAVGCITKRYSGIAKELLSDATHFSVNCEYKRSNWFYFGA